MNSLRNCLPFRSLVLAYSKLEISCCGSSFQVELGHYTLLAAALVNCPLICEMSTNCTELFFAFARTIAVGNLALEYRCLRLLD